MAGENKHPDVKENFNATAGNIGANARVQIGKNLT